MAHENSSTKSIDVGSVFLMDLSVNESELCGNSNHQTNGGNDFTLSTKTLDNDQVFPRSLHVPHEITLRRNNDNHNHNHHQLNNKQPLSSQKSIVYKGQFTVGEDDEEEAADDNNLCDYLGESLDRLACVIDGVDHRQLKERRRIQLLETNANLNSVTIAEAHRPPEIIDQRPYHQSSLSSLSDESFGISSCGGDGNSLSASYTASSEPEDEDLERSSTATREDSGVLDMKDLDSQFNDDSYDINELDEGHLKKQQEKPISDNIKTVTNLINNNKSAELNDNPKNDSNNMGLKYNTSSRFNSNNAPTNKNNNHHHNHHHHHSYHNNYRAGSSKRPMSASLPIQVPARQMKRDVRKLKLNQLGREATITQAGLVDDDAIDNRSLSSRATRPVAPKKQPIDSLDVIADDLDDEFLQQEYNDNHHNHYPADEFDREHVRADENPMKLFESIQALARSLLEDTELFGSLPPKRMLESPIRSLAFA